MARRDVALLRDAGQAAPLLSPLRRRLLERLAEPGSATSLSAEIGIPRQHLNYHLRRLERAGLVELIEERQRRGCRERIVRATARAYVLSPEILGRLGNDPEEQVDRFSASHLLALAGRALRDLAALIPRARAAKQRLATLALETEIRFASAERRHAFAEELATALAHLTVKYHEDHAPGGRRFRVFLGAYPAITRPAAGDAPPAQKG
jgi:DNA-binding transcriptional ArsR family regulator